MSEDLANAQMEILRLKVELLEEQLKNSKIQLSDRDQHILSLKDALDEPQPLVGYTPGINSGGRTTAQLSQREIKEALNSLSPAELFMLAKKKGISIERIFPI